MAREDLPEVSRPVAAGVRAPTRNEILRDMLGRLHGQTDRLFLTLFGLQWLGALAIAVGAHPAGDAPFDMSHGAIAAIGGGLLMAGAVALTLARPGWWLTRHAIAVGQIL